MNYFKLIEMIHLLLLLVLPALALDGFEIYKRHCSSCHSLEPPPLKAPPMSMVSRRVKVFYPKEEDFVRFVKDYIVNPSREKGVCMPMAYRVFGVMPPVGRTLSEEEREAVARWLYRSF